MKKINSLTLAVLTVASLNAHAWVQTSNTSIKEFIQWEDGNDNVVLKLHSGHQCYFPVSDRELYSLTLAFYMSGKQFNVHCHNASENIGGYPAHKIHRMNGVN